MDHHTVSGSLNQTSGSPPQPLLFRRKDSVKILQLLLLLTGFVLPNVKAKPTATYECPASCDCAFDYSWHRLTIECNPSKTGTNSIPLFVEDIQHLILREAKIGPAIGIEEHSDEIKIGQQSSANTTTTVTLDLLTFSMKTLRKLELYQVDLWGNVEAFKGNNPPPSFLDQFLNFFVKDNIIMAELARLQNLDNLTVCDSSHAVSDIIIKSLPLANHISITSSSISELSSSYFRMNADRLTNLQLSGNSIQKIPFGTLRLGKLVHLDVSNNQLEHLQEGIFEGLYNLRKLNVSHNFIKYIDTDIFKPLKNIEEVDLSYNKVIQIFEPYFENNPFLNTLIMRQTWAPNMFKEAQTSSRSRKEMDRLLNSLTNVTTLDLRENQMITIPESLAHMPKLSSVLLGGNLWTCTCQDTWFPSWIETTFRSKEMFDTLQCYTKAGIQRRLPEYLKSRKCDVNVRSETARKYYCHLGQHIQLRCHVQNTPFPSITWITPGKSIFHSSQVYSTGLPELISHPIDSSRMSVNGDGSLHILNFTRADFGLYKCVAQYETLNVTHYVHVGVDTSIFSDIRIMSFIVGWLFSFAFLFVVVVVTTIWQLLNRCGVECAAVSNSYNAKRLRAFLDNLEQHKTSQLDWLRDNYNMQARRIKDNCICQLEKIRDSYTAQQKNLSDIREYGTNQIHQLRDQYFDQVRRVSGYSTHQLCKVRENYLFQRNRVCKFSSHQLIRLRETYKWQAQTLNKILENLPRSLNLDTCRGIGTCGRTDSIYLDDLSEFQPCDELDPISLTGKSEHLGFTEKLEHVSLLVHPEFVSPGYSAGTPTNTDLKEAAKPEEDSCLPITIVVSPKNNNEVDPQTSEETDLNCNM